PLRECADGQSGVAVHGETVEVVLAALISSYPRLRRHLYDDTGALRGHVNVYLNEEAVEALHEGSGTPTADGDTIVIVPSVAGGESAAELTSSELARYSRHLALPDVGLEGQKRLRAARVALVGAGGLGSPLGLYLAAAGVGTLGLIDFDDVDLTNLQRQVLYGSGDIGRPKTEAAAQRLADMNPHVAIEQHRVRL